MRLESIYQEIILDHYKSPHGRGLKEPFDAQVHHSNPVCGDEVVLRVKLDHDVVREISHQGQGCSISQASTSVLTDLLVGKPIDDAMRVHQEFVRLMQSKGSGEPDEDLLQDAVAFAGVSKYPARIKCALLGWMAWKDAVLQVVSGDQNIPQSITNDPFGGSKDESSER